MTVLICFSKMGIVANTVVMSTALFFNCMQLHMQVTTDLDTCPHSIVGLVVLFHTTPKVDEKITIEPPSSLKVDFR